MNNKLNNFVIFPREIASDYRSRKISLNEFILLAWLRLNANPYGIAVTSIGLIQEDFFFKKNSKSVNYINKILLSLKKKRYLFFSKRSGLKGSFEIRFGYWIIPGGEVRQLDSYFDREEKNMGRINKTGHNNEHEESQRIKDESQTRETIITSISNIAEMMSVSRGRGHYNDTENKKEKDKLAASTKEELDEWEGYLISIDLG